MNSRQNWCETDPRSIEWQTLGVALLAYGGFGLAVALGHVLGGVVAWTILTLSLVLHASLLHEILHGHPFRQRWLNEALAFPAIGLFIPYGRFRDTHLAHHHDPNLTDPYDDPESNFADPCVWNTMPKWRKRAAEMNNTLLGRMVLGPAISLMFFYRDDVANIARRPIWQAYVMHVLGVAFVAVFCAGFVGVWMWISAAYAAMSILKIRTFLEHRAHDLVRCRTVIIEDRGPLAFLFLNNSLHAVHHAHPQVPWYRLWALYLGNREQFLVRNDGYSYASYAQIIRAFFFRAKDPVPHPLRGDNSPL